MRLMSDGGSHNVLQIDPWFIERVDVIRGPSSALYGQSVPGGVVNLTSKRPQFTRKAISASAAGRRTPKGPPSIIPMPSTINGLTGLSA
jgi:iron complex outermembrane receptor protein